MLSFLYKHTTHTPTHTLGTDKLQGNALTQKERIPLIHIWSMESIEKQSFIDLITKCTQTTVTSGKIQPFHFEDRLSAKQPIRGLNNHIFTTGTGKKGHWQWASNIWKPKVLCFCTDEETVISHREEATTGLKGTWLDQLISTQWPQGLLPMHVHTMLHSDTIETDEVLEDGKIRGVLGNRDLIITCTLALRAEPYSRQSPYDINRTAGLRQKHSVVRKPDSWGPRGSSGKYTESLQEEVNAALLTVPLWPSPISRSW